MKNTPTQQTILQISDELDTVLIKLRFMSDSIRYWNTSAYEFSDEQLYGFGLITEQIIDEIDGLNKGLEPHIK